MTREERLRDTACRVMDWTLMTDQDVSDLRIPLKLALAIARRFADAEAAAMRERAAGVCEAKMSEFADAENAGNDEAEEAWHGGMAHAALVLADAIRALPTTEVGNG